MSEVTVLPAPDSPLVPNRKKDVFEGPPPVTRTKSATQRERGRRRDPVWDRRIAKVPDTGWTVVHTAKNPKDASSKRGLYAAAAKTRQIPLKVKVRGLDIWATRKVDPTYEIPDKVTES